MVQALIKLMDTDDSFTGPVNLGNPVEISIHDIAAKIIELTGSGSDITYLPLPQDDPMQRRPTFRWRGRCWTGSRRPAWRTACVERSSISTRNYPTPSPC